MSHRRFWTYYNVEQLFRPPEGGVPCASQVLNKRSCRRWTIRLSFDYPLFDYPLFALIHTCIDSCICVYGKQITNSTKFVIIPILHSNPNGAPLLMTTAATFKVVMGMTPPFSLCRGALPRILQSGRRTLTDNSRVKQYVTKITSSSVSHQSHFAYPTVVYTSSPY